MVTRERDEELALFLELRRKEKNNNFLLLNNLSGFDHELDGSLLGFNDSSSSNNSGGGGSPSTVLRNRKTAADNFLNSESDKSDYEWLITPPSTPLFPSLENELGRTKTSELEVSDFRPNILKQRITNVQEKPASRNFVASKNSIVSSRLISSININKRPSSSGGPKSASRPATPTGRPGPTLSATSKPSRPSTPTRSIARSLTPTRGPPKLSTGRSSSVTREAPPGRSSSATRPNPPGRSSSVTKPGPASRSSSVTKSTPTISKMPSPSRGITPTIKSRPWKPSDMPGFSHDTPSNLRTSLSERPSSASRVRPSPKARSPSVEAKGRPRQQSCSPSRGRPSNGSVPSIRKTRIIDGDNISPVVIGTKMVERDVKSSSLDKSGFGRNLSKNALDMAMRHMDITRSIPGKLHSTVTKIPASSMYSVRSGLTKNRTPNVLDSPLATSSNASSELCVNGSSVSLDSSEMDI